MPHARHPHPLRHAAAAAVLACLPLAEAAAQAAPPTEAWPLAGQQGLVRYVIVPAALARDRTAYQAQIERLCEPETTCFVNFYTNTTGAALGMPLADAIEHEATATYRRSMKNGAQRFMWSCRLQMGQEPCF